MPVASANAGGTSAAPLKYIHQSLLSPVILSKAEAASIFHSRDRPEERRSIPRTVMPREPSGGVYDRTSDGPVGILVSRVKGNESAGSLSYPTLSGKLRASLTDSTEFSEQSESNGKSAAPGYIEMVNLEEIQKGLETRSTFMIRRLPRFLTADQLVSLLASPGLLDGSYDLLYVPVFTGKNHANRGYAFINFKSAELGALFLSIVQCSTDSDLSKSLYKCDIVYAHVQGRLQMLGNLMRMRIEPSSVPHSQLPPGLLLF